MSKQTYPTDLTDSQWNIIQVMIPLAKSRDRPRSLNMRQVINAIVSRSTIMALIRHGHVENPDDLYYGRHLQ